MRKVVGSVILAATIAGAITLMIVRTEDPVSHINQIIEWVLLWIRDENNRNLLTAVTTIAGIIGWSWAVISWLRKRDTATQLELLHQRNFVLQKKIDYLTKQLTRLPEILVRELKGHHLDQLGIDTRIFQVENYRLEARVLGTVSSEEQRNIFAGLEHAIKQQEGGDGIAYSADRERRVIRSPMRDVLDQKDKKESGRIPGLGIPLPSKKLAVEPDAERDTADLIRERLENNVREILKEAESVA